MYSDSSASNAAGGQFAYVANVCATSQYYVLPDTPDIPEKDIYTDVIYSDSVTAVKMENIYELAGTLSADTTGYGYIEMDFYVSDYDAFTNAIGNNGISALNIWLLDSNGGYAFINILDQIVSEGWNHVVIQKSDMEADAIDFSDIESWQIMTEPEEINGVDSFLQIAVANIGASNHIKGDANHDGKINVLDLIRLKKYFAASAELDKIASDIDGNKVLQTDDMVQLYRNLLG